MCTYPTFITLRFVRVVSSPDKLSRPSVVNRDACLNCSAKQLSWFSRRRKKDKLLQNIPMIPELKASESTILTCLLFTALTQLRADSLSRNRTNATPLLLRVSLSLTIVTLVQVTYMDNIVIMHYSGCKFLVWATFNWKTWGKLSQKILTSLLFHILWIAETRELMFLNEWSFHWNMSNENIWNSTLYIKTL